MTYKHKITLAIAKLNLTKRYNHLNFSGDDFTNTTGLSLITWLNTIDRRSKDVKIYILRTINHLYKTGQLK